MIPISLVPAVLNYAANGYTYGEMVAAIGKRHLLFGRCGIRKGDKIALCAKNSAEWCNSVLECLCKNRDSAKYFAESLFFYDTFSVSLQIERIILRSIGHFCINVWKMVAFDVLLLYLFMVLLNARRCAVVDYDTLSL